MFKMKDKYYIGKKIYRFDGNIRENIKGNLIYACKIKKIEDGEITFIDSPTKVSSDILKKGYCFLDLEEIISKEKLR